MISKLIVLNLAAPAQEKTVFSVVAVVYFLKCTPKTPSCSKLAYPLVELVVGPPLAYMASTIDPALAGIVFAFSVVTFAAPEELAPQLSKGVTELALIRFTPIHLTFMESAVWKL